MLPIKTEHLLVICEKEEILESRYSILDNETGEIVKEINGRFISEEQD
ncbi:hypothetical protein [Bacillus thuringiensis]|nr:hypothetical protein [Bacillus thuringiensis]